MAKGRDNEAESLGDLLELVRVRRQSGSLSVERFQGGRFEEGEIYFQGGQPTYAHAGQMTGQEALTWMLSWNKVFFSFTVEETRLTATISSATSANSSNAISTNVPTAPFSTKYPSPNTSGMLPTTPSSLPQVTSKEPSGNFDGPLESVDPQSASGTPGLEWLVPQKLGKDRDVLSLPLTRPQRSIYLLVDGRRTISDLSRCTRKSTQEIERLLSELRERGLIAV
jgi:Domain of unknown function (DUF4388)